MTTQGHLVYRMQELYAFERDFLPMLIEMQHASRDTRLRELVQSERDGVRVEVDTLERALNLLGAQYKLERSAVVPGVKESMARFEHQLHPNSEQQDVQHLLLILTINGMIMSSYEGDIELAQSIGEQDVAMLLRENLQRNQRGHQLLLDYLPVLLAHFGQSGQGERRWAA